jgi:hypothetical protein
VPSKAVYWPGRTVRRRTQLTTRAQKRGSGRPRCRPTGEEVRQIRCQGLTWRQIGKRLGVGTATAIRLYKSCNSDADASQNSFGASAAGQNRQ